MEEMMLMFLVIVSIVALLFLGMMIVMTVVVIGDYLTYRSLQRRLKEQRANDEGV